MSEPWRLDPTQSIDETDPEAILEAVRSIIDKRHHGFKHDLLRRAMADFLRLCNGDGDFAALDTPYHDLKHSMACVLAMARLLDAHARRYDSLLSAQDALLGMLCALFHDVGYLRRHDDAAPCGAALTPTHVSRGGAFLREYLPQLGIDKDRADSAAALLQYTGYEQSIDDIILPRRRDHELGTLLGTADLIGQTADTLYPEKCATLLWQEFRAWDEAASAGHCDQRPPYDSAEKLLRDTPAFHARLREERLEGLLDGAWSLLDHTMGSPNPYRATIDAHLRRIGRLIDENRLEPLLSATPASVLPPLPSIRMRGRAR